MSPRDGYFALVVDLLRSQGVTPHPSFAEVSMTQTTGTYHDHDHHPDWPAECLVCGKPAKVGVYCSEFHRVVMEGTTFAKQSTAQESEAEDARAARHARVIAEVRAYLAKGLPLSFALSTVQSIENSAARAEGLDYGPVLNVERVWELGVCEHGTIDPDNPSDPCMQCAVGA